MNNPILRLHPPRGPVLWWWIMTHNLDIFLSLCTHEVYVLTDQVKVLWLKVTGRYTPDYHVKKMFANKLPAGTEMWLIIAHLLKKVGVYPHDSKGLRIAGAFQPRQLTLYTADPLSLQWVAYLRHLTTMEDVFDGLAWMRVASHEELENALGLEEYMALKSMTIPEALKHIRPQVQEKKE
jgi:hypothetical protein